MKRIKQLFGQWLRKGFMTSSITHFFELNKRYKRHGLQFDDYGNPFVSDELIM